MDWTSKEVTDDGQRVEITRLGPYRWQVRHLGTIADQHDPCTVHRTRREAIQRAEDCWAIHPARWAE